MIIHKYLFYFVCSCFLLSCSIFVSTAQATITVTRDTYGVAKIRATTNNELFFAFGFVQASDRILQMELLRQNAWGTLPALDKGVIGKGQLAKRYARNGKKAHRFPDLKETLKAELNRITNSSAEVNTRQALICFAQGINSFRELVITGAIGRGQENLATCGVTENSTQFLKGGAKLEVEYRFIRGLAREQKINLKTENNWHALDVLAVFQDRVMEEFSYRNTDLHNLLLLANLMDVHDGDFKKAGEMFNSIKWSLMPHATTTLPMPKKSVKQNQARRRTAQYRAYTYHKKLIESLASNSINGCKIYNRSSLMREISTGQTFATNSTDDQFPQNASNWWILTGKSPDDRRYSGVSEKVNTLLYSGPQTGANDPSNTYQIALLSDEGFRFAGNTYTGTINFWQGHNGVMAFGLTAGNVDVADSFCVPIQKNRQGKWEYDTASSRGGKRKLNKNTEATNAINLSAPSLGLLRKTLYNVEGTGWPVIFIDTIDGNTGTAYIQRSNWEGLVATSFDSMLQASQATNFDDWNTHLDTVAANFNLSAAHKDGKIGYRLTGKLPIKRGMEKSLKTEYGPLKKPEMGADAKNWNYFPDFDPRLPVPLSPEIAWDNDNDIYHSLRYVADNGFLANWNQKPWTLMPDGDLYYDGYYPYDRVNFINNKIRKPRGNGWTLSKLLIMNNDLQRMDLNFFSYKFFLKKLLAWDKRDRHLDPALNTILAWSGYREEKPVLKDSSGRVHYGHVLFFEFLEGLNKQLREIVNPKGTKNKEFSKLLNLLFKLKQPKLNGKNKEFGTVTVDTSQNMQLSSRVLLNWLHYHLNSGDALAQQYTYDNAQSRFVNSSEDVYTILQAALNIALTETRKYPAFKIDKLFVSTDLWMRSKYRTLMGFSTALGYKDLRVSFRPKPLFINDFRNRGAFNVGVAFKKDGSVEARNVTPPGIREYRGEKAGHNQGGLVMKSLNKDLSSNQIYNFGTNYYRKMHDVRGK